MKFQFDANDLRPLVELVVAETIERLEVERAKLNGQLGYPEPQAAALLGLAPHQLRDARLRGEVRATRIGKRMVYPRGELLKLLGEDRQRQVGK